MQLLTLVALGPLAAGDKGAKIEKMPDRLADEPFGRKGVKAHLSSCGLIVGLPGVIRRVLHIRVWNFQQTRMRDCVNVHLLKPCRACLVQGSYFCAMLSREWIPIVVPI